jgi:methionyl-tRNA formyltransferase
MSSPLRFAVCGTTLRTVQCAEALAQDERFSLAWGVTPVPRPIGRKHILTPTPLDLWLQKKGVAVHHVEKSLKPLTETLMAESEIDFLLVVDFGYLVPEWLIQLPKIAPINVHPSDLPKYRGSSPAQFVLLYGEKESAVTIMRLTAGLDEGPIIHAPHITVDENETQESYYKKAFELAAEHLPNVLFAYAQNRQEVAQPEQSPTPIAKRFSREDGYIPYSALYKSMRELNYIFTHDEKSQLGPITQELLERQPQLNASTLIERSVRALNPWPGVWTTVPEHEGRTDVRLKLLEAKIDQQKLIVTSWQFDGEQAQRGRLILSKEI